MLGKTNFKSISTNLPKMAINWHKIGHILTFKSNGDKHAAEELISYNNQQIIFWNDSLSALQALSNKIHNKSITGCHKALTKLADENTVQLKWIKAHTGHWGNEKADELAKAGTVSSNLVCSLVPLNHIKNMINDKVLG